MNWFFVVGCPRSGTTLLQQALNRHPSVAIPPETAFFTYLLESGRARQRHVRRIELDLGIQIPPHAQKLRTENHARELFQCIAEEYLIRLGRRSEVTHFGEKSPEHLRRHYAMRRLFPEAKVILIYRDGRDVALSLSKVPWMPGDLYLGFALWSHYNRVAYRAERLFGPDLHLVKYEDLVREPDRVLRSVCRFLRLDFHPSMASGCGNSEGIPDWERGWKGRATELITDSRIGVWRSELSVLDIARLERWGGWMLTERGYELTVPDPPRLPIWFYPRLWWNAGRWLAFKQRFGGVGPVQAEQMSNR